MSKTRWGWWLVICTVSACATTTSAGPGKVLTELPHGIDWCGERPEVLPPTPAGGGGGDGIYPASIFKHCSYLVQRETVDYSDVDWAGTIVFGLNTNEHGLVTSLCVWGGNYGNAKRYLQCLAETMLREHYVFPPNLEKTRYRMTYVYGD